MSVYLQKSKSTLTTSPTTLSSRSGHVADQGSMKSILQSCLESLDRLHDGKDYVHKEILRLEILEIRTRITELLSSCQSDVTMENSGTWDSSIDLRAIVDDEPQIISTVALDKLNAISLLLTPSDTFLLPQPPALHGQLSDREYGPLESVEVTGSLPEGADRSVDQLCQDLLLGGTSSVVSHEPGAQPFLPQHGMYSEGHALYQQPPLPIVQGGQDKAVCAGCGKGFTRPYMKKDHICRAERRSS
ncbi:hypothetical protein DFH29DRAFT_1080326 [Suillus ampliporus]|nr:hypothetical protein DFH29DRAFT_1080326 [Suillus ampliporus]